MGVKKISELDVALNATNSDLLAIEQDGKAKQLEMSKLASLIPAQYYCTCYTSGATIRKTVQLSSYVLKQYVIVAVDFPYGISVNSATLNINNTGDIAIHYRNNALPSGLVEANDTLTVIFDGLYYRVLSIAKVPGSSGGSTITVDDVLDDMSVNPVQNRVITAALNNKAAKGLGIEGATVGQYTQITSVDENGVPLSYGSGTPSGGGGSGIGNYYVSSSAGASTTPLNLLPNSDFTLTKGVIVAVTFTMGSTAPGLQININSTGAKYVLYNQAQLTGTEIQINDTVTLMYDGIYYEILAIDRENSGGGSTTLSGLTDTDIDSPTDGQALVYSLDGGVGRWVNREVSGSGGKDTYFANCSTSASAANKAITISNFQPDPGTIVSVYFQLGSTTDTMSLIISGTTYSVSGGIPTIEAGETVAFCFISIAASSFRVISTSGGGSSGATSLDDLSNVSLSSLSSGQVLTYNGSEWVNQTPSGGGGDLSQVNWYGTSSIAAVTAAKTVTCSGYTLATGEIVAVRFSNANTASNATLNVNSTGAKSIRYKNAATTGNEWEAGDTVTFLYDGTYYRLISIDKVGSGGGAARDYSKIWYINSSGTLVETSSIQTAIDGCPIHGTVHIPWKGTSWSVSSAIHIWKPITLEGDYSGYWPVENIGFNSKSTANSNNSLAWSSISSSGTKIPVEVEFWNGASFTSSSYSGSTPGPDRPLIYSSASDYGIYIHCYGVTLRNISLQCYNHTDDTDACLRIQDDFGYDGYSPNSAQKFEHHVIVENCYFRGTETKGKGVFCSGIGLTKFSNVTVCYVKDAFWFGYRTNNTSTTLINCWAWNFSDIGYYFDTCDYCTLISCAADTVATGSQVGYYYTNCTGCTAISCGAEQTEIGVAIYSSKNISFGGLILPMTTSAVPVHIYTASDVCLQNLYVNTSIATPSMYVGAVSGSKVTLINTNVPKVNSTSVNGMYGYVAV